MLRGRRVRTAVTDSELSERALSVALEDGDKVSAVMLTPRHGDVATVLVLAHGAGNDMHSGFLSHVCDGVARTGIATLKFNFPYKEKGRKAPDPAAKLEATWRAVLDRVRTEPSFGFDEIFVGGKSLGGRMASRVVAQGEDVAGLVFLGYPLHPPGKTDKLRSAHFPEIAVPALFIQGTRDSLCNLDLLRGALPALKGNADLRLVDDGDHSFNVPKRAGKSQEQIWNHIVAEVADWISARRRDLKTSPDGFRPRSPAR